LEQNSPPDFSSTVYFSRTFSKRDYMDSVVIALDLKLEPKAFSEFYFHKWHLLKMHYSGKESVVANGSEN
jgi:hypothetical protein